MRFCGACVAALIVLFAGSVTYLDRDIKAIIGEKELAFNSEGCKLIGADVVKGGEDMALWRNGIAIVSAGDLFTTFTQGPVHAKLTGIFAVSLTNASIRRLELEGFPQEAPYVGQGLHISNKSQRLYGVNHGGDVSQIEIFAIEGHGFSDLRLRHTGRIRSALFPYHCIGDVVEGRGPDEVFVGLWRGAVGVRDYNLHHEKEEALSLLLYRYISRKLGTVGVLQCTQKREVWSCQQSGAWGMPAANSLTIAPDRTFLLVSCPQCLDVWRYRMGPNGTLTEVLPRIPFPYPPENIEWDEATGRIFVGAIPVPSRMFPLQTPIELMALRVDELSTQTATPHSLLLHDGSKLTQMAGGLQYGATILMGSPYAEGLLFCHPLQ